MRISLTPLTFVCFTFKIAFGQNNDPSQYKFSSDIYDYIKNDSSYWLGATKPLTGLNIALLLFAISHLAANNSPFHF